jgi:dihydroneopterin aldolase
MTRLLASVADIAEARLALAVGADIIDTSRTERASADEIAMEIAGRAEICAAADLPAARYVRGTTVPGKSVVGVLAGSGVPDIAAVASAGAKAAVLETEGTERLFATATPAAIAAFVADCRRHGLESWIGGSLEPPDIPRLLEYAPDVLCLDGPGNEEFRALVPRQAGHVSVPAVEGSVDRILVRDFVLPVEVGAYEFERHKSQRVRFSVEAEVRRRVLMPKDMRDVFSYDIILDIIRTLVGRGHTVLVETLAEQAAERILQHEEILSVMVRVEKLDLGPGAVGVEIVRRRQTGLAR